VGIMTTRHCSLFASDDIDRARAQAEAASVAARHLIVNRQ
jgi:hypothetical protein